MENLFNMLHAALEMSKLADAMLADPQMTDEPLKHMLSLQVAQRPHLQDMVESLKRNQTLSHRNWIQTRLTKLTSCKPMYFDDDLNTWEPLSK